jgi:hypothetical protein
MLRERFRLEARQETRELAGILNEFGGDDGNKAE